MVRAQSLFAIAIALALAAAPLFSASAQDWKTFPQSNDWKKIGPRLQQAWTQAIQSGNTAQRFDCFVRDQDIIGPGDRAFLISAGFVLHMVEGRIANGYLLAGDLPRVASQPFVEHIELSTK